MRDNAREFPFPVIHSVLDSGDASHLVHCRIEHALRVRHDTRADADEASSPGGAHDALSRADSAGQRVEQPSAGRAANRQGRS